jgi:hypothetical protein
VQTPRPERLRLLHERESVPEGNERARAAAFPPAGGKAALSSCSAFSRTRKIKSNIQEGRGEEAVFLDTFFWLPLTSTLSPLILRGERELILSGNPFRETL